MLPAVVDNLSSDTPSDPSQYVMRWFMRPLVRSCDIVVILQICSGHRLTVVRPLRDAMRVSREESCTKESRLWFAFPFAV